MVVALVKKGRWRAIPAAGRPDRLPRLRRAGWIGAQIIGWPLLLKAGLLTGFALAASVQHLLAL